MQPEFCPRCGVPRAFGTCLSCGGAGIVAAATGTIGIAEKVNALGNAVTTGMTAMSPATELNATVRAVLGAPGSLLAIATSTAMAVSAAIQAVIDRQIYASEEITSEVSTMAETILGRLTTVTASDQVTVSDEFTVALGALDLDVAVWERDEKRALESLKLALSVREDVRDPWQLLGGLPAKRQLMVLLIVCMAMRALLSDGPREAACAGLDAVIGYLLGSALDSK